MKLAGFGLNARLQGKVEVRESPNEKPTGSGDIGVAGTFNAYGQDLTISDGHLMFAGTPLNDPQLNITATRQVQDVSARLMITGTAQRPLLNVSSNQDMSQTEALADVLRNQIARRPGE